MFFSTPPGPRFSAVCKGPQVDYNLGTDQQSVTAVLRVSGSDTARTCATFSPANGCSVLHDGTNGKLYVARDCTTSAPCPASPAGAFLEPLPSLL